MIRINLLPYREARHRREILQHLLVAAGVLVLAVVCVTGTHIVYSNMLSDMQAEQDRLVAENRKLKRKIGEIAKLDKLREQVQVKLDAVVRLQEGRFRSLKTLVALSESMPENVWVSEINDEDGRISISGFGESNRAVAGFMRALQHSALFTNVKLEVIEGEQRDNLTIRKFDMTLERSESDGASASGQG